MKISSIDIIPVTLPFRGSFKHNLAERRSSTNLIVKVTLSDGTEGYGEGVPRDYVTGENIEDALWHLKHSFIPHFLGYSVTNPRLILSFLEGLFNDLGLKEKPQGAAWCALELAVLDAVTRAFGISVAELIGPVKTKSVYYGAVVPLVKRPALLAILWFYKLWGFKTIKIKVGQDLEESLSYLHLVRKVLGNKIKLRIDANCAWSVDQTLRASELFKAVHVDSFEQPVAARDFEALKKVTSSIPQEVIADESLCTLQDARVLAAEKICTGFNIRISKVGGVIVAKRILEIANSAGIYCHLGAQVGESGILSAAGRIFACTQGPFFNHEGNSFLLRTDLTRENLTVGYGGKGNLMNGPGLGVTVIKEKIGSLRA